MRQLLSSFCCRLSIRAAGRVLHHRCAVGVFRGGNRDGSALVSFLRPLRRIIMTTVTGDDRISEVAKDMGKVVRGSEDWETIWTTGGKDGAMLMPGEKFDAGKPSPFLEFVLASCKDSGNPFGATDVTKKRVLVPGCGRGYDLIAFSAAGVCESIGIDVAPTGVAEAALVLKTAVNSGAIEASSKCEVHQSDFYSLPSSELMSASSSDAKLKTFDVVYDYTFFCAMHPERRQEWREMMAKIVTPGVGQLWTLIFPVRTI